jgi:hypothetical protein
MMTTSKAHKEYVPVRDQLADQEDSGAKAIPPDTVLCGRRLGKSWKRSKNLTIRKLMS